MRPPPASAEDFAARPLATAGRLTGGRGVAGAGRVGPARRRCFEAEPPVRSRHVRHDRSGGTPVGRPLAVPGLLVSLALAAAPLVAPQEGVRTERLLRQGVTYPTPDRA